MKMTVSLARRPKIKPEKGGGPLLYQPGYSVTPQEALQQYSDKDLLSKAAHYYEEQGVPIPEFEKMDKIQKLEMLNVYREEQKKITDQLDDRNEKAKKFINNQIKLKQNAEKQQQQQTAGSGPGSAAVGSGGTGG